MLIVVGPVSEISLAITAAVRTFPCMLSSVYLQKLHQNSFINITHNTEEPVDGLSDRKAETVNRVQ
jgi:hypothetical protein